MTKKEPQMSIYMTTYNGEKYIKRAIDSVIKQSYTDWEFIIINNFSSDKTTDILEFYSFDSRIKIFHTNKLLERTKALNFAIKNSSNRSKYLMNLDSDDILADEWIKNGVHYLNKNNNAGCISGAAYIINERGEVEEIFKPTDFSSKINNLFYYTFPIVHSSTIFKRDLINDLDQIYNESIKIGQDWDLFINISRKTEIHYTNIFSVYWRRYKDSITGSKDNQILSRLDKIRNLKKGSFYISNLKHKLKNRSRRGIENLVLSFLYLKKGDINNFIYRLFISFFLNPLAIVNNNKVLGFLNVKKEFYKQK